MRSGQQGLVIWVIGTLAAVGYLIYGLTTPVPYEQFERLCTQEIAPVATPELGRHTVVYRPGSRTANVKSLSISRFTAVKVHDDQMTAHDTMYGTCSVRNGKARLSEVRFE